MNHRDFLGVSFLMIARVAAFTGVEKLATGLTRLRPSLGVPNLINATSALVTVILQFDLQSNRRDDVYNILWAVVFGFATLNILSLAARRFEPNRRGLTFGELLAVLIVLLSVVLLGWELLSVFKIFPLKLHH
jgi:hypothetical protein